VAKALDRINVRPFDLVLRDIILGEGKSGTEWLHLVRRREGLAIFPAGALMAYSMPRDPGDLLAEGFDGYGGKPLSQEDPLEAINQD